MNKIIGDKKIRKANLDIKKWREYITFKNFIFFLVGLLIFLVILQQIFYRPPQISLPQTPEERLEAVELDLESKINNSDSDIIIVDDNRILTYDEFNRLLERVQTDKRIIPSGKLLKEWLQTDDSTPFNNENSEYIFDEIEGDDNPYEGGL